VQILNGWFVDAMREKKNENEESKGDEKKKG
jgi:hypothetical protein